MLKQDKKKKIIKLTEKLISFESTKDKIEEKIKIINFIEKYLNKENLFVKKFSKNKMPSLIVKLRKEKHPKLLLAGHLDVVEAKKSDFKAKIRDNRIYGRGSGDMKMACAVMIEIMINLSKREKIPSVGLILTTDEEIGGFNGTGYLVNKNILKPKFAIVPDGGINLETITLREKGVLQLKIFSYGKAAHGSRPFLGENAAENLINVFLKLKKYFPDIKKGQWETTMNLGIIKAGETINKVPDYAEMFLDFRLSKEKEKVRILRIIKSITPNFKIVESASSFLQSQNNKFLKNYKRIAESKINKKVIFDRQEGASDARFFSNKKIPTIITKINCGNIHGSNEWVDIKESLVFYDILIEFAKYF